jgi:hypothetical protein
MNMQAKDFSDYVAYAAITDLQGNAKKPGILSRFKTEIITVSVTLGTSPTMVPLFFDPLYHLTGALAYIAGNSLDYYSTYQAVKQMEDKRFIEYGLDKYFSEKNVWLPNHPTRKDIFNKKEIAKTIGMSVATALVPPGGYSAAVNGPLLYKDNTRSRRQIEKSFEIGDHVKSMINCCMEEKDVKRYLQLMCNKKLICGACKKGQPLGVQWSYIPGLEGAELQSNVIRI